jgi:periplasmic protein TonB
VATPPPKVFVAPEPLPELKKQPAAKSPRVAPPAPRRVAPPPRPAQPQRVAAPTPPLVAPIAVPTSLPPVNLKAIPTVSDVVAMPALPPVEPARAAPARTGGSTRGSADGDVEKGKGGLGSGDAGRAFDASQVDRAVSVTRSVVPRYPEALRSVSVQGDVFVRYIVDTRGRVEPGSIEVISTSHKLFADAVRTALLSTRFRPAEAGGRPVRQLVEQPFKFRLNQ